MSAPAPAVLVVCTANQCRSALAAALLADRLGDRARVASAGTHAVDGRPATGEAVRAAAALGLSLAEHRSRALRPEHVADADLVVTMTRGHLREVVSIRPDALAVTFTMRELAARRAVAVPGVSELPFDVAVRASAAGRRPSALLGRDPSDDVADPTGRGDRAVAETAVELAHLVDEIVTSMFGRRASGPGGFPPLPTPDAAAAPLHSSPVATTSRAAKEEWWTEPPNRPRRR